MPTIAITGKGGTGKTTFAALLIKYLSTQSSRHFSGGCRS